MANFRQIDNNAKCFDITIRPQQIRSTDVFSNNNFLETPGKEMS